MNFQHFCLGLLMPRGHQHLADLQHRCRLVKESVVELHPQRIAEYATSIFTFSGIVGVSKNWYLTKLC